MTSYSARLVWTVGQETDHGDAITSFDVEAETNYHPGDWQILASGLRFTLALCRPLTNMFVNSKKSDAMLHYTDFYQACKFVKTKSIFRKIYKMLLEFEYLSLTFHNGTS